MASILLRTIEVIGEAMTHNGTSEYITASDYLPPLWKSEKSLLNRFDSWAKSTSSHSDWPHALIFLHPNGILLGSLNNTAAQRKKVYHHRVYLIVMILFNYLTLHRIKCGSGWELYMMFRSKNFLLSKGINAEPCSSTTRAYPYHILQTCHFTRIREHLLQISLQGYK